MALTPSTDQFPILGLRSATPRYRRRQRRSWTTRALELGADTAARLPHALAGSVAAAIVLFTVLGLSVPRAGDLLAVAVTMTVLGAAGYATWKATVR